MRLDNKGAIDMMFIALLVVLLAAGGFVAYRVNQADQETADSAVATEAGSESRPTPSDANAVVTKQSDSSVTDDWITYKNDEYGFEFSHPEDTQIAERSEALYFEVTAIKNSEANPPRNVFGQGDYKIQIQVYSNDLTVEQTIAQGVDGELDGAIAMSDGIETATTRVSSEEAQGPPYDIYWYGKDGTVWSVAVFGDPPFTMDQFLGTFLVD